MTERKDGRFRYYSVDSTGAAQDVLSLLQGLFQASLSQAKTAAPGKKTPASRSRGTGAG